MFIQKSSVTIVTAVGGAGEGFSAPVNGRILGIVYTKTDYAAGVDFTATLEGTGEAIMVGTDVNATATFYPRPFIHDAAGLVTTLRDYVHAAQDRVKIVVAQGGDVKTGTFTVIYG